VVEGPARERRHVMTAFDRREELGSLYRPRTTNPTIVEVPSIRFLMIDGSGAPSAAPTYMDAIATLYPIVYTLKFTAKTKGDDFRVMPLETLWWSEGCSVLDVDDPEGWRWTAMIAVPDPVTRRQVDAAIRDAGRRRTLPLADEVRLQAFHEGRAAQVLHVGPYGDEGPTIASMERFIEEQGFEPSGKHHEIYLSDPNRTASDRLRTIVRIPVRRARRRVAA
jgi:hypothetical protein